MTTASKLIETITSSQGTLDVNHSTIVLAILGYTPEEYSGKHPPKTTTFRLTKMATCDEVAILTDLMIKAGYAASSNLYPAFISRTSKPEDMKQQTIDNLKDLITRLTTVDPADPDAMNSVTTDRIWEIWALANYFRGKKITKIVIVSAITVAVVAIAATGLYLFFGRDDDKSDVDENDSDVEVDTADVDPSDTIDIGDLPPIVIDDSDKIEI